LARNSRAATRALKVHAYDVFTWDRAYDVYAPRGVHLAHGQSFRPLFERNVRPWLARVAIHEGDLLTQGWAGGPVELLLNDVAKSFALAAHVWGEFVTRLVPGGLLIEQDFKHHFCPWLHVLHHRFRDHFALAADVAAGATTAFWLRRPVPADQVRALTADAFDDAEVADAIAWAQSLVGREWRPALDAAHAMWFVHRGRVAEARDLLAARRAAGVSQFELDAASAALARLEHGTTH
jgi:hypothetical protein